MTPAAILFAQVWQALPAGEQKGRHCLHMRALANLVSELHSAPPTPLVGRFIADTKPSYAKKKSDREASAYVVHGLRSPVQSVAPLGWPRLGRCIMRSAHDRSLFGAIVGAALFGIPGFVQAQEPPMPPLEVGGQQVIELSGEPIGATFAPMDQSALDATAQFAQSLDGAGAGVSADSLISALESAAAAGQPMALWQLGTMYENGEGVTRDPARAFGYFSQIANQHADTPPRGVEADIVAQSFVKVGEYYRQGLPAAGINVDMRRSHALLMHAATYFGDAEAQYLVGRLYLDPQELGVNPLQGARWLSLAARKGHGPAQALLGEMLFNGFEGVPPNPVEGLMWLTMARQRVAGTIDESWVGDKLTSALGVTSPEIQLEASTLAAELGPQFNGL